MILHCGILTCNFGVISILLLFFFPLPLKIVNKIKPRLYLAKFTWSLENRILWRGQKVKIIHKQQIRSHPRQKKTKHLPFLFSCTILSRKILKQNFFRIINQLNRFMVKTFISTQIPKKWNIFNIYFIII